MKKIITTLAIAAAAATSMAQAPEHLDFEGIAINGTIKEYAQKLEDQGFAILQTSRCYGLAAGSVGSFDNCMIDFLSNGDNVVFCTVAYLPGSSNWLELAYGLNQAIPMFSDKYGEPEKITGNSSIQQASENQKFEAATQGRLDTKFVFSTPNGYIEISAQPCPMEKGKASISITYIDKKNKSASRYSCNCLRIDDVPCLADYAAVEKLFKEREFKPVHATDKFKYWEGDFDVFGKSLFVIATDSDNYVTNFMVSISEYDTWQLAKKEYNTIRAYLQENYEFYDELPLAENGASDEEMLQKAKNGQLEAAYFAKRSDGNIAKLYLSCGLLNNESTSLMIDVFDK